MPLEKGREDATNMIHFFLHFKSRENKETSTFASRFWDRDWGRENHLLSCVCSWIQRQRRRAPSKALDIFWTNSWDIEVAEEREGASSVIIYIPAEADQTFMGYEVILEAEKERDVECQPIYFETEARSERNIWSLHFLEILMLEAEKEREMKFPGSIFEYTVEILDLDKREGTRSAMIYNLAEADWTWKLLWWTLEAGKEKNMDVYYRVLSKQFVYRRYR